MTELLEQRAERAEIVGRRDAGKREARQSRRREIEQPAAYDRAVLRHRQAVHAMRGRQPLARARADLGMITVEQLGERRAAQGLVDVDRRGLVVGERGDRDRVRRGRVFVCVHTPGRGQARPRQCAHRHPPRYSARRERTMPSHVRSRSRRRGRSATATGRARRHLEDGAGSSHASITSRAAGRSHGCCAMAVSAWARCSESRSKSLHAT